MAKNSAKGLGKGLGALFGDEFLEAPAAGVTSLPIAKVEASSAQPRKRFDEESLADLAESIKQHGIIQPLTVRLLANGYYQIIAGERRWRAARLAGLSEVPVIVIEADDRKAAELALIENLQREDLNPVEEAEGFRSLMENYGMTQEEAAGRVSKSRSAVANSLRLLNLTEPVSKMLSAGAISAGHARALLALRGAEQEKAAKAVADGGLSVRQTEALVKKLQAVPKHKKVKPTTAVDYSAVAEKELSERLGRGCHIVNGRRKGHIEIEYYDMDDLNNLLDALAALSVKGKTRK
ncbi:MAG: ParB/RepB/Spo0J family partition protein [Oscillospiraceae bacterium]|nr:ParB/RepB/Spo0J family partition protein [Oscillospiraceae bacterium]